jgi:2',3'-cyclic-nucleotide 2'-phosphodiesterase (5'-nucleotidase family)
MAATARTLSRRLRQDERCDLVVALTHNRMHNDYALAEVLAGEVDMILGGHDHHYECKVGHITFVYFFLQYMYLDCTYARISFLFSAAGTED